MCGIVGYIGRHNANEVVLLGLKKLEYRGYDSVGMAYVQNKDIKIIKDKGRVFELENNLDDNIKSSFAIGHTRWATHGIPNKINSHPHVSESGRFTIVHNGVIENFKKLKDSILKDYNFESETDTEVIANLIEMYSKIMSTEEAIKAAITNLEGSYALLVMDKEDLNKLYFVKNRAPLIIGQSENGIIVASDIIALVGYCENYMYLDDQTFGVINGNEFVISDFYDVKKSKKMAPLLLKEEEIEKGNYEHYMLKEIHEQPSVIRRMMHYYFDDFRINIDKQLLKKIRKSDKLYIVACGSSYYAGAIGKYYFEKICGIPVEICIASEVAYLMPNVSRKSFFIFISQSGETADSIRVLKECNKINVNTLGIVNNLESTIARLTDHNLYLYAGKEIAVASTKAYVAQVVMLYILANAVFNDKKLRPLEELNKVIVSLEEVLSKDYLIQEISKKFSKANSAFYIGRGINYYVSLEAALKLKEISYIHAEGYASGELKHGSIALINKKVPVIAIITNEETEGITRSNLIETISRDAIGIVIVSKSLATENDDIIIPDVNYDLSVILSAVVCQLIAYYVALSRGNDIDKPKNLAKSVTVE